MAAKDAIIKRVYFDSGALGSIKRTLKEAKEIDPSIKEKDVKSWKDRNIQRKIRFLRLAIILIRVLLAELPSVSY